MAVRMDDGSPLFDSVQATWNLLEQSAGKIQCLIPLHTVLVLVAYRAIDGAINSCIATQIR